MAQDEATAERVFHSEIDARFPYADAAAASDLIARGRQISANAAFTVLEEISRPPRSASVSKDRQAELLAEWSAGFEHPLKSAASDCVTALIAGARLPLDASIDLIDLVSRFPGQWAALNLAYFAADISTPGAEEELDALVDAIRRRWSSNAD